MRYVTPENNTILCNNETNSHEPNTESPYIHGLFFLLIHLYKL